MDHQIASECFGSSQMEVDIFFGGKKILEIITHIHVKTHYSCACVRGPIFTGREKKDTTTTTSKCFEARRICVPRIGRISWKCYVNYDGSISEIIAETRCEKRRRPIP